MSIYPFLSHKREDADLISDLRDALRVRGAGGWQDTQDLLRGSDSTDSIVRAIKCETGGFIWYGTPNALDSKIVRRVELPTALRRARREKGYPLLPLFSGLRPSDRAIRSAYGRRLARAIRSRSGEVLEVDESVADFHARVARRYVRDALTLRRGSDGVSVCLSMFRDPPRDKDLLVDWTDLLDESHVKVASPVLQGHLADVRDALQASTSHPQVTLEIDAPLPVAMLVGYELRVTTKIVLAVEQRTGAGSHVVDGDGSVSTIGMNLRREELTGSGPWIVSVSGKDNNWDSAYAYAEVVSARGLTSLVVEGILDDAAIRGLARRAAHELRVLASTPKHLLIRGPVSLAVLIGVAANATGATDIPAWNGTRYEPCVGVG